MSEDAYGNKVYKCDECSVSFIEGFDEETAEEIQNRAREFLAKQEAELDGRRKELGVADELRDVAGVTTAMMVKLGENDVTSIEDLAGCATDDLVGWSERKDGETIKNAGFLDGIEISRDEAEAMIMDARVKAGWVEAPAEVEAVEDGAESAEG
jgi:N utilization substance protein A